MRPLDGITVVSLEQAVAAPFATRQLADLGARVVKIERPGHGDFARRYDAAVKGESSYFVWLNRSKESLTLDVKSPEGNAVLHELLAGADVLVQNLAPGAADRLGLGAAARDRHPELITCDLSGYGGDGPWADRKAYDMIVQCEVGMVAVNGTPDHGAKVGVSIADIAAGMYAYSGVLTALLQRANGRGTRRVEVSLFDALAEWMGAPAYFSGYGGAPWPRVGVEHPTICPYGQFESRDEVTIVLAVQNEREWGRFCAIVLADPALATDGRFASNTDRSAHRVALNALVARRFAELDAAEALALLDRAGVANGRVSDMARLWRHPVLRERDRWREVDTPGGPVEALLPPAVLQGVAPRMDAVPALGEHTESILARLGYAAADIRSLRDRNVV